jgi:hypothetical protein
MRVPRNELPDLPPGLTTWNSLLGDSRSIAFSTLISGTPPITTRNNRKDASRGPGPTL